jgi:hypothetical protein
MSAARVAVQSAEPKTVFPADPAVASAAPRPDYDDRAIGESLIDPDRYRQDGLVVGPNVG